MFNFSKTLYLEFFLDWSPHIKRNFVFDHMRAFATPYYTDYFSKASHSIMRKHHCAVVLTRGKPQRNNFPVTNIKPFLQIFITIFRKIIAKLEDYNFPSAVPPNFSNRHILNFPPRIRIFRENYLTQSNGIE